MKKFSFLLFTIYLTICVSSPAFSKTVRLGPSAVQSIHKNIEARIYAYKKTQYYTALEIGFTNLSNKYIEFTPKEIYLDDAVKYSLPLLSMEQIHEIEYHKPSKAIIPTALAIGLGITALATHGASHDVSFGLAMGALAMGGAAVLTKGFENQARQNKLVSFENNALNDIKKLPPGVTLGGVLYFPPTKKPQSVTIVSRDRRGRVEKAVFYLPKKSVKKQKY